MPYLCSDFNSHGAIKELHLIDRKLLITSNHHLFSYEIKDKVLIYFSPSFYRLSEGIGR